MTPQQVQNTFFFRNTRSAYDLEKYPNGQPFKRLTLTLSAKGWTASVEWEGTTGIRGTGKTQEEAIEKAVKSLSEQWGCYAVLKGVHSSVRI